MDDDDTGYASGSTPKNHRDDQVQELVLSGFHPLKEEYRASRATPSCASRTLSDSEDSTDSAINVNDLSNSSRNDYSEVGNISHVQYTKNKTLSFFENQDGTGYCSEAHSNLRQLTLDRSIEDKFRRGFAVETDEILGKCDKQSMNDVSHEDSRHESCQIPLERTCNKSKTCNLSFSSDFRQGSHSHGAQSTPNDTSQRHLDKPIFSEDFPDFPKTSCFEQSQLKRKDANDERPMKRAKCDSDTVAETGVLEKEDLPSVDVAGHGNLLLLGNSNMTVNFYSNSRKKESNAEKDCWDWTGTSEKETQVENVTGVIRKFADNLSQHVDHRKVARNLEFSDMITLEDDLKKLRTLKTAESDRIFFVLVRWWKDMNFGNDRDAMKSEMSYLLEDLKLQRMKRNLKQFFD